MATVKAAVAFAEQDPEPRLSEMARGIYSPRSGERFALMLPGSPFGERELVFDGGLGQ